MSTHRTHPIFSGPQRKPDRRTRVSLKLEEWPDGDRTRWVAATVTGDLFDDPAPAAHLRPRSRLSLIQAYGRWLGFLARAEPDCLEQAPGERVSRELIEQHCRGLAETNSAVSIASHLRHLRGALLLVAQEVGWDWLLTIAKQIEAQAQPRSKRDRLRMTDELYELGLELIRRAEQTIEADGQVRGAAALTYRDGLIISILALAPVRRRNLQSLRPGMTLQRVGENWSVVFLAHETKSGKDLDYPLPPQLTALLDRYLLEIRPAIFGAANHDGLWASAKGCPMTGNALYDAVCRRTKEAFGRSVNLHLFRDAAVTFIATTAPEQARAGSELLGHENEATTDRHYRHGQTVKAGRVLADVISTMRADLKRNSRKSSRR